jgi:hypothetical protein
MNCKGCGRKRSWYNLGHALFIPDFGWSDWVNLGYNRVQAVGLRVEIWTQVLLNKSRLLHSTVRRFCVVACYGLMNVCLQKGRLEELSEFWLLLCYTQAQEVGPQARLCIIYSAIFLCHTFTLTVTIIRVQSILVLEFRSRGYLVVPHREHSDPLKHTRSGSYTYIKIKETLHSAHRIHQCVLRTVLTINSDCFPKQH